MKHTTSGLLFLYRHSQPREEVYVSDKWSIELLCVYICAVLSIDIGSLDHLSNIDDAGGKHYGK